MQSMTDGWYATGDGGILDEDGFLYLTDRITDMIVTGGENVFPIEVENILLQHPSVADCAVFGIPDNIWGERICAAAELRSHHEADPAELMAFLNERIAGYKVPKQIEIVAALPRTATGKVQRTKVRLARLSG
jgi:acyl-CoA synthetase (AMP-forming)/AMP-acid ligase II